MLFISRAEALRRGEKLFIGSLHPSREEKNYSLWLFRAYPKNPFGVCS
jgi:hypothetical protein